MLCFDLSFDTVANVIETWEAVKRIPDYQELIVMELCQRYVYHPRPTHAMKLHESIEEDHVLTYHLFLHLDSFS